MRQKCPANVPQRSLKQHPVHHLPKPVHVAVQHVAVHIQRRGDVAVPQPRLDVLGVPLVCSGVNTLAPVYFCFAVSSVCIERLFAIKPNRTA